MSEQELLILIHALNLRIYTMINCGFHLEVSSDPYNESVKLLNKLSAMHKNIQ